MNLERTAITYKDKKKGHWIGSFRFGFVSRRSAKPSRHIIIPCTFKNK